MPVRPNSVQPSKVTDGYWLFARHSKQSDRDFSRCGKWMLMAIPNDRVDDIWRTVAPLVEAGQLGPDAKVSTARPNPNSPVPGTHAIMIYAHDWRDTDDLRRILTNLRHAGLGTARISFKRDDETFAGAYQNRGSRNVSVFVAEPGGADEPVRLYTSWLGPKTYLDGSNDAEIVAALAGAESQGEASRSSLHRFVRRARSF